MRRMIKRMTAAAVASGLAVSLSMTALAEEIGPGFETPARKDRRETEQLRLDKETARPRSSRQRNRPALWRSSLPRSRPAAAFQFLTAGREQSSIRRAWCPIRC